MFDAVKAKDACVQWIKDWFAVNGPNCAAVIGISGGKDSSVAAALCAEALGADRVIGVMMPNGVQIDLDDSDRIINYLKIKSYFVDIEDAFYGIIDNLSFITSSQARINLPPRLRMATLYAVAQSSNGRVCCTDNASEAYIGYSTRWGDNVGDFSPLVNFTSDEVVAIGDALGLPYELTHKIPSDGLCGRTDEDNFGFTYAALNKYIRTGECDSLEVKEKIDNLHNRNLFKLQPIPSFKYVNEEDI